MPPEFGRTPVCSIADSSSVPGNDPNARCRTEAEIAARAALELHLDRSPTDAEWAAMRVRLVEFASILRAWDRAKTIPPRCNVEVLC